MTKFAADNVDDFMDKAHAKYGGDDLGTTDYDLSKSKYTFKDGKLKPSFDCNVTTDYAEVGSGKPDKANKEAIAKVAAMAKSHEEKHQAGYEAAFNKWNAETTKDLTSKTFKDKSEADKAFQDAMKDLKQTLKNACLDLHKKEGLLEVTHKPDGSIDVTMKAAGPSGCV